MYKSRVGPIIQKQWTDSVLLTRYTEEEKARPIPAVPISFRNANLSKMLRAEPTEVQDGVEVWRQAQRSPIVIEGDEDDAVRLNKASKYQM